MRGLGALLALLVGLVGVPWALVLLGGNPVPTALSWEVVRRALLQPDDGTVLVGLVTVVGWAAWVVFALSVLAELVSLLSGYRFEVRLPGLAGPQRLAAGLLVAVFALVPVAPGAEAHAEPAVVTVAPPPPPQPGPPAERRAAPSVDGPSVAPRAAASGVRGASAAEGKTHVVEPGDDLWSLAERYYGAGRDWRKIAMANPDVLSGGPDRLRPGWRLVVPGVAEGDAGDPATVTVRPGDTLSGIAERALGQRSEWRDLYRANRAQLSDPDELAVGVELRIPGSASAEVDKDKSEVTEHDRGQPRSRGADESEPSGEASPTPPRPAPPRAEVPPIEAPPSERPEPSSVATAEPPTSRERATPDQGAAAAPDVATLAVGVAGVGALLAAGLVAGLTQRRRIQLQARPLGRRIVHPSPAAQRLETALGARQQPMGLRSLDLALRAISAHCLGEGQPVPRLTLAAVAEEEIELTFLDDGDPAPAPFAVSGRSWRLDHLGLAQLRTLPHVGEALRPYPALVTLGEDDQGRTVLADLETLGLLALAGPDGAQAMAVVSAMALELAFSPWADEMILTLVGSWPDLSEALDKHNVTQTEDLDELLDRLEQRANQQRQHRSPGPRGRVRIDPDLADPWAPEVVLVSGDLTAEQRRRLVGLLGGDARPTLAVVVTQAVRDAPWRLELGALGQARLEPAGLELRQQFLERTDVDRVVELAAVTASVETTPAPWWVAADEPDPPPDNVTYLGTRFGGWGAAAAEGGDIVTAHREGTAGPVARPPVLQLLGPVELVDAAGVLPPRASKQCLEYCAWLLEHPGTTAQAMAAALVVAEGTRRSNMSRLRSWLGTGPDGEPYLPDAYTGRISLHPSVTSDWRELQLLTSPGVNHASDQGLRMALELVRGAPLADAAPGQWHWAEELRTDMISAVRDIGVELTDRALDAGDIEVARWAAARALVAAPGDELLLSARVRTEHQAGNPVETERLTLQLVAQSRALGVDLDPATVSLLQRVMEGRVRARLA